MEEKFLTVREVAQILNVQRRTVQRLMKSKKLPGLKVGKEWRVRDTDLTVWVDESTHGGGIRT
jgi:excisionase family DNA binding protein